MIESVSQLGKRIAENIERVIVGKPEAIRLTLLGLLAQGHILIEDVPGTGKTVLAKSLARSIGGSFNRIQFTPDMLPSDVTGVSIFNQQTHTFEYRPGPVLAQVVLIDEINRATPKTQAALLEVMEERQVTVDGVTYPMPTPFLVLATQNPIEYEGTFLCPRRSSTASSCASAWDTRCWPMKSECWRGSRSSIPSRRCRPWPWSTR